MATHRVRRAAVRVPRLVLNADRSRRLLVVAIRARDSAETMRELVPHASVAATGRIDSCDSEWGYPRATE